MFLYTKSLSIITYLNEKGFFDLLTVQFLTQFLGFGSILLVAKFLTPVEFGEVKILQTYVLLLAILAGFGINTAILKVCSEDRPDREKAGILRYGIRNALFTTALTLILVIVMAFSGRISSNQYISHWFIVYGLIIPLEVLTGIFIVFLQAQKRIKEMARSQAIVRVQSVLLIVIGTWLWGFEGFIIATIVSYALGLWPFLRLIGFNFFRINLENKPSKFMNFALFSVMANGVSQLSQRGDILILDQFSHDRVAIGFYSLALIFVAGASQVTSTVQLITTPYFSERAGNKIWFRRQLILNQGRMALLSVGVAFGVFIVAKVIIPLIYGAGYISTIEYLNVLLLKYVIWSSSAVMGSALLGLGLMNYNFIVVSIVTPLGLLLSYSLLQRFGVIGVAWAQVGSASIQFVLLLGAIWLAFNKEKGEITHGKRSISSP